MSSSREQEDKKLSKKKKVDIRKIALACGTRLGEFSLALLFATADAGISIAAAMLTEGVGMRGRMEISSNMSIWDWMEEIHNYKPEYKPKRIYMTLSRLEEKGLVIKSRGKYKITKLGFALIARLKKRMRKEEEQKAAWDGKFRVVAFDIPDKKHNERGWLSYHLELESFTRFQKSVFIGKQPISQSLFREIEKKGLRAHIRLLVVGDIDDEALVQELD